MPLTLAQGASWVHALLLSHNRPRRAKECAPVKQPEAARMGRCAIQIVSFLAEVSARNDTFGLVGAIVERSADVTVAAKLFCGFGDRTRLSILRLLADGERRVTDIVEALDASQANISGHLKCLRDSGLVVDRRSGREAFYRIAHSEVVDVLRSAEQLLAVTGTGIELCSTYADDEALS